MAPFGTTSSARTVWRSDGLKLPDEPGRDTKSVHREVAMLAASGPIECGAADEVAVGWDRAVTELELAA